MNTIKFILIGSFVFLSNFHVNSQTHEWAKLFRGTSLGQGQSTITLTASLTDQSGNIYTSGQFSGIVDFNPGPLTNSFWGSIADGFITKLDNTGNIVWAKHFDGTNVSRVSAITFDLLGNIYATGNYTQSLTLGTNQTLWAIDSEDVFICKLDPLGNVLWAKSFGSTYSDLPQSIYLDENGNVNVVAFFENSTDFAPNGGLFLITVDSSGSTIGTSIYAELIKSGGTEGYVKINSMIKDASGNIYTSGLFANKVNFNPRGIAAEFSSIGYDIFISKQTSTGDLVWVKQFGGDYSDSAISIDLDAEGNIYTTGQFDRSVNFGTNTLVTSGKTESFICKLDNTGNVLWAKQFAATAQSVSTDISGNVFCTGSFSGTVVFDPVTNTQNLTSTGNKDIFILKLDKSGNFISTKKIGGLSDDLGRFITKNKTGFYLTGNFGGTVDFNPDEGVENLSASGTTDVFLVKMNEVITSIANNNTDIQCSIYPNPTTEMVQITLGKNYKDISLSIRNELGQLLFHKTHTNQNRLELNLEGETGVYFVSIQTEEFNKVVKILKKHN